MLVAQMPVFIAGLAALTASGLLTALVWPKLFGGNVLARRVEGIARDVRADAAARADGGAAEHRPVRDALREVDEVRRARNRRILIRRLREAGLTWSKRRFHAISAALGLAGGALGLMLGEGVLVPAGFALGAGVGLPNLLLSVRKKRRISAMTREFPAAIDIVVRGVKSGLPFQDCLRIIAQETRDPLRSEFQKMRNDLDAGLPMGDAVQRFAERVPLTEANFFAIVITIQARTGGNLSDSLGNLSTVLRERKKMRDKIKSMSSEAKASGAIIGSLPFLVGGIMTLTSPDYIALLFTETIGNLVLIGSGLWMGLGILVMGKMINFDF